MANEEQIVHKAIDWYTIGNKMPCGSPHGDFSTHVIKKSARAITEKGEDFVYGETVTQAQAETIRSVAKKNDIKPVKGRSAS